MEAKTIGAVNAEDLMVDNWVEYKRPDDRDWKPIQVYLIDASEEEINTYILWGGERRTWDDNCIPLSYLRGILLTAELLEKCGFEYMSDLDGWADKNHIIYENINGVWAFHPFCTNDEDCHLKLQYLHQLQNLCAALSQPLEIKL